MPTVRVFTTAEASEADLREIRHLLDEAFGGEFSDEDWQHASGGWHVTVTDGGVVRTHAAVVPRTLHAAGRALQAGYVEAVGTHPAAHRAGLGSLAMVEISRVLHREFELGALSTGARGFYAHFGWERWLGPTFVRRGTELTRTEDDDDGIMVLRFGASQGIDVTAALSCEDRPGDPW